MWRDESGGFGRRPLLLVEEEVSSVSGQRSNSSQAALQLQCRRPTGQRRKSRSHETAKAREEKMAAGPGLLLEDKYVHAVSGKEGRCLQRKSL